jgi:hypothetical protein
VREKQQFFRTVAPTLTPSPNPSWGSGSRARRGEGATPRPRESSSRASARTEGAQAPCELSSLPSRPAPGGSTIYRCIDPDRRQRERSRGRVIAQRIPTLGWVGAGKQKNSGRSARQEIEAGRSAALIRAHDRPQHEPSGCLCPKYFMRRLRNRMFHREVPRGGPSNNQSSAFGLSMAPSPR